MSYDAPAGDLREWWCGRRIPGEPRRGFMGTFVLGPDSAKRFGFSVGQGESPRLYRVTDLLERPVIQDRLDGEPIVVFFDRKGFRAMAWARGSREFRFEEGAFLDGEGRRWDPFLGEPVAGAEGAERLRPLPTTAWLIHRWRGFYPESEIHRGEIPEKKRRFF